MTVMSNNGAMWLENHDFKLLVSRKPNEEFLSTLVAIDTITGRIDAKIEPTDGGKNQFEAFKAFKKHVEMRLGEVLESIPDAAVSVVGRRHALLTVSGQALAHSGAELEDRH